MRRALVLVIILCGCGSKYAPPPPPIPEALGLAPAVATSRSSDEAEYVVKSGDTLESVATGTLGWSVLWRHLMEWNKLHAFGRNADLPAGSKIYIPDRFRILLTDRSREKLERVPRREISKPWRDRYSFAGGETLDYKVKYLGITAGHATMSVHPPVMYQEKACLHFSATARSKLLFFYKVEDRVESLATVDQLMPQRFEKHLREGRYSKDLTVTFDLDRRKVEWEGKTAQLGRNCRDIMAAFFHFRSLKLPEPGKSVEVCVHTNGTNYPLVVEVMRREKIRVPAGEFMTLVVKPRMKFEGLFRQKGDILIWLTEDDARVPVLVRAKVFLLGSVNIILTGRREGTDGSER